MSEHSPYKSQSKKAFWRAAVAERHFADIEELWIPFSMNRTDKVATAGSCFAQHIGNNLARRGAAFMDLEPSPPLFASDAEARRWGYGVYSCRYGNIYTTRQLIQLYEEAFGRRIPVERVWRKDDRFFDALRPSVDPVGQASAEDVLALRERHLFKVRELFETLDLFVFTMGLTEGWEHMGDGTMYPTAPGTICGNFDPQCYRFHNLRYGEVLADMTTFWEQLRSVNPRARMLLTVSPVPLTATATEQHVLVATSYSKSVLRAVAGELAEEHADISYFPSYEIISSPPARGMFFDPNLRSVNPTGVNRVMTNFFSGDLGKVFSDMPRDTEEDELSIICDEEALDDGGQES